MVEAMNLSMWTAGWYALPQLVESLGDTGFQCLTSCFQRFFRAPALPSTWLWNRRSSFSGISICEAHTTGESTCNMQLLLTCIFLNTIWRAAYFSLCEHRSNTSFLYGLISQHVALLLDLYFAFKSLVGMAALMNAGWALFGSCRKCQSTSVHMIHPWYSLTLVPRLDAFSTSNIEFWKHHSYSLSGKLRLPYVRLDYFDSFPN